MKQKLSKATAPFVVQMVVSVKLLLLQYNWLRNLSKALLTQGIEINPLKSANYYDIVLDIKHSCLKDTMKACYCYRHTLL